MRVHNDYGQARKDLLAALRTVLGLHEGCPQEKLDAECAHLLECLGGRGSAR